MELKQVEKALAEEDRALLIVPYGIETPFRNLDCEPHALF